MFYVGQKVVCVNDSNTYGAARKHGLRKGIVYTIENIGPMLDLCHGYLGVYGVVSGWHPARFRPLVERKTDIGVFTAMLNPGKVDA